MKTINIQVKYIRMSKNLLFLFKKEKTNYFYTRLYIVNSITYNTRDLNYYLFFIKGIKHKRKDFFIYA